jgi:peptidoglycan hydrolase CwlO-like protein
LDSKITSLNAQIEELNTKLVVLDHEHDDLNANKASLEDKIAELIGVIDKGKIDKDIIEVDLKR